MTTFHRDATDRSTRLRPSVWTFAALLATCVGCSRQTIDGTVTLDDRPLEQGYINFRPLKNAQGSPMGAAIHKGKYCLSGLTEPREGPFRVEITALGTTGKTVRDDRGQVHDVEGQVLPARYNTQSTLQVEIKPDGHNELPFSIQSK